MKTKLTPAMKDWCKKLLNPNRCTVYTSCNRRVVNSRGGASISPPAMPMFKRLLVEGLIELKPDQGPHANEGDEVVLLTTAGREVANG